MQNANLKVN